MVQTGLLCRGARLGEGTHRHKLAPSRSTPHPSRSSAAGWEQGEFTWALDFGIVGEAGAGRSQAGARQHLQPHFRGFSASRSWEMVEKSPNLAEASGTTQEKTASPLGSCFLHRSRSPSGSAVRGSGVREAGSSFRCIRGRTKHCCQCRGHQWGSQVNPEFPLKK